REQVGAVLPVLAGSAALTREGRAGRAAGTGPATRAVRNARTRPLNRRAVTGVNRGARQTSPAAGRASRVSPPRRRAACST
ncbi:hypothetical protein ACFU8Q_34615, partial [Streptomyces sp. NPDC057543]|uniref:hypothetical protein n=1 Tax=Streptomyces sp. NPDC057543 TaxID=3346163 RepID=UPI003696D419